MADQKPKLVLFAGVASMLMVSGMVFFIALGGSDDQAAVAVSAPPAVVERIDGPRAPAPAPVPAAAPGEVPRAAQPGAERGPRPSTSQRMGRDLKREQIWQALAHAHELEPAAPGSAAPPADARAQLPALDPQYIQEAIAEQLVPVAIECYESALEDEPELAGQLLVEFTIVGAEEVGGVVEDAQIQADSTLDNAFVRECIRESVMAVSFEAPEAGGQVQVTYPMNFEPE